MVRGGEVGCDADWPCARRDGPARRLVTGGEAERVARGEVDEAVGEVGEVVRRAGRVRCSRV
jgi:hypothetical protein